MIRFAWLQARTQILVAAGGLAIVAIVVALTGPHLHHLYDVNVAHCATRGDCDIAKPAFLKNDKQLMSWFGGVLLVVPAIIGLFWGPPLVARELETGTFRLAWTQSITRSRWFAMKLAVVGAAAMAVAGLLSLMATWWASPIDTVNANRFACTIVRRTRRGRCRLRRVCIPRRRDRGVGHPADAPGHGDDAGRVHRSKGGSDRVVAAEVPGRSSAVGCNRPLLHRFRSPELRSGLPPARVTPDSERLDAIGPDRRPRGPPVDVERVDAALPEPHVASSMLRRLPRDGRPAARCPTICGRRCKAASRRSAPNSMKPSDTNPRSTTGRSNGSSSRCSSPPRSR